MDLPRSPCYGRRPFGWCSARRPRRRRPRSVTMKIRVGCDLTYEFAAPTPVVLMVNVHPSRAADMLRPDLVRVAPLRPLSIYNDMFGNTCCRLVAPAGELRVVTDTIVTDSGLPDEIAAGARQHAVSDLPHEALMFLMGSRYCEVDKLN